MESLGTAANPHGLGPNQEKENLWKVLVGEIYKSDRVRRTRTVWLGPQTKLFSHERVLEQQQQPPLISEESSLPYQYEWIFGFSKQALTTKIHYILDQIYSKCEMEYTSIWNIYRKKVISSLLWQFPNNFQSFSSDLI